MVGDIEILRRAQILRRLAYKPSARSQRSSRTGDWVYLSNSEYFIIEKERG